MSDSVPFEIDTLILPINTKLVSDGHHTFEELYRYRLLYNAAFFNMLYETYPEGIDGCYKVVKSRRHSDGELCFGDPTWFIVVWESPEGQVSNHYRTEHWDLFKIPEVGYAPKYDGHNAQEAADRLETWLAS